MDKPKSNLSACEAPGSVVVVDWAWLPKSREALNGFAEVPEGNGDQKKRVILIRQPAEKDLAYSWQCA